MSNSRNTLDQEIVNLPSLFEGLDFNQLVGEVFDELDNEYKNIINLKLEGTNQGYNGDEFFINMNSNSTRDGRAYGDFSKLM